MGLGLLNKHSMLLWIAGTGVGLVATRRRRDLATPMPWLGLGVAAAVFAPNLLWQAQNDWATVTFLRGMSSGVLSKVSRPIFLLGQGLFMNPLAVPVWTVGLVAALRGERTRLFGVAFLAITAMLLITRGKPYYLAPAYPVLFAIGAVAIERWAREGARRWVPRAEAALLALSGGALGLQALPILSVETLDRVTRAMLGDRIDPEDLSRELRDEFGWREQAAVVGRVHASLTPEEQTLSIVLTGNYGEASAVAFFGGPELHPASGHLSWHDWGFEPQRGSVVIAYGLRRRTLERFIADVREVDRIDHPYATSEERDLPVYVCRGPIVPLTEAWPSLRRRTN